MKKYIKASNSNDEYTMLINTDELIFRCTNDICQLKQAIKDFESIFTMDSFESHNLKVTLENLDGLLHEFNNAIQDEMR